MKDKLKDTKGLNEAYMSLAKHYDERKENAIRQVKDGAFVDLLNQEQAELQKAFKEKQIEEIKQIIDDRCEAELGQVHASSKGGKVTKTVDTKLIAKDIYEYLTKDSVVLSREEYEKLKGCENTIKRLSKISVTEAESENKSLKDEIAIVLAQKRNIWKSYNQLKEELVNSRKETADKILNEINHITNKYAIKVNRDSYENCGFIYMVDCGEIALCLDKFAKQFGVGIKE